MTMIETPLKYSKLPEYFNPPASQCPGCSYGHLARYLFKALGPKVLVITVPGCGLLGYGPEGGPFNEIGSPFGNSAGIAGGAASALEALGDTETVVVPLIGDGGTVDIGFGALSGAAERNDNILFVCKDNEAYANTGNQRSSAAPLMSTNATNPPGLIKKEFKKDAAAILAAHYVPYLATATVAFPDDLMRKVAKAKSIRGFRFIHVLCPCTTGWGFPSEKTIEISRLAVDTKAFPLYEVENGVKYTINHEPKGLPLSEYTNLQRRFRSMSAEDLAEFEKGVEDRWQRLKFLATYNKNN